MNLQELRERRDACASTVAYFAKQFIEDEGPHTFEQLKRASERFETASADYEREWDRLFGKDARG